MNFFSDDLARQLEKLRVQEFEYIMIYSDFRALGRMRYPDQSKSAFLGGILESFLKLGLTAIVPTYTYTSSGIFDPSINKSNVGALSSFISNHPKVSRSEHPIFSYAAIGPKQNIVFDIGKEAFGEDSIYARLLSEQSCFLHLGRPVEFGNTMLHFVEKEQNVPYRFEKKFPTQVYRGTSFIGNDYSAFVRKLDNPSNDYHFSFKLAAQDLYSHKMIREYDMGGEYSKISIISSSETYRILVNGLCQNSNYFLEKDYT
jgi:aminoglycoside 3-N-acetyltransferase